MAPPKPVDMAELMRIVAAAEAEVDQAALAGQVVATEAEDEARYEGQLAKENRELVSAALEEGSADGTAKDEAAQAEPAAHCARCGKPGATKRCARCRAACYCSRGCQTGHWKLHKKACTPPPARAPSVLSQADVAAAAAAFGPGGAHTLPDPVLERASPLSAGEQQTDADAFRTCAELFCKDLGLSTWAETAREALLADEAAMEEALKDQVEDDDDNLLASLGEAALDAELSRAFEADGLVLEPLPPTALTADQLGSGSQPPAGAAGGGAAARLGELLQQIPSATAAGGKQWGALNPLPAVPPSAPVVPAAAAATAEEESAVAVAVDPRLAKVTTLEALVSHPYG